MATAGEDIGQVFLLIGGDGADFAVVHQLAEADDGVVQRPVRQLLNREAESPFGFRINKGDPACRIRDKNGLGGFVGDIAAQLQLIAQLLFGLNPQARGVSKFSS